MLVWHLRLPMSKGPIPAAPSLDTCCSQKEQLQKAGGLGFLSLKAKEASRS